MTRGHIHGRPVDPEMGFNEFLKRILQTSAHELDSSLEGTHKFERNIRPKKHKRKWKGETK